MSPLLQSTAPWNYHATPRKDVICRSCWLASCLSHTCHAIDITNITASYLSHKRTIRYIDPVHMCSFTYVTLSRWHPHSHTCDGSPTSTHGTTFHNTMCQLLFTQNAQRQGNVGHEHHMLEAWGVWTITFRAQIKMKTEHTHKSSNAKENQMQNATCSPREHGDWMRSERSNCRLA